MGKIEIDQIEFYACHGVFEIEKKIRQRFLVSLSFEYDFEAAAKADDLSSTINYTAVFDLIEKCMAAPVSLLETLVYKMAHGLHAAFPGVKNIVVSIEKPEVQLGGKLKGVRVSYTI